MEWGLRQAAVRNVAFFRFVSLQLNQIGIQLFFLLNSFWGYSIVQKELTELDVA